MSHNQLVGGDVLPARPFGLGSRSVSRIQAQAQVGLARVAQQAALHVIRVEAVACVTRRAMFETALVTQAEQSLATLVPMAAGRLQAIADVGVLGIAEVVADMARAVIR